MSSEVLNSHKSRVVCLPNPEDYMLVHFIGEKRETFSAFSLQCNVLIASVVILLYIEFVALFFQLIHALFFINLIMF